METDVPKSEASGSSARAGTSATGALRPFDWGLVALLALVLAPAVFAMADVWSTVDYYSHGYMVPLVALWAASAQRAVLPTLPRRRDARGIAWVALALVLYTLGMAASLVSLAGLAIPVALAGLVLYLRGPAWLRRLSFSIGYLVFMVPLPPAALTPIIVKLQLFVSVAGVSLLQGVGYSVQREGNVIQLPDGGSLFVAEACSGITSIVTLVPLGVFLAYFTDRRLGARVLLVATVIPVAMLGNLVRVVVSVVIATRVGAEAATQSSFHEWLGVGTYVLACVVLLGIGRLIQRTWPDTGPATAA